MAEVHAGRFAALFSADADLQGLVGLAAPLYAELDEFAHAGLVYALERVASQDLLVDVVRQESAEVVPAKSEATACLNRPQTDILLLMP